MNTIIDRHILDELTAQAQALPRLRMNLSFHWSLEGKWHRIQNTTEPGTGIPIHRLP